MTVSNEVSDTTRRTIAELEERDLLDVAHRIAKQHDVTLVEMLGRRRERACIWAMQALWSELYARGHWSYPRLGRLFDRDHTTVVSGIRAHLRRTSEPVTPLRKPLVDCDWDTGCT